MLLLPRYDDNFPNAYILVLRFQDHVKKHLPSEVIGVDEFLSLRREVLAELNKSDTETPDEAPPGVEAAPGDEQVGTNVVRLLNFLVLSKEDWGKVD